MNYTVLVAVIYCLHHLHKYFLSKTLLQTILSIPMALQQSIPQIIDHLIHHQHCYVVLFYKVTQPHNIRMPQPMLHRVHFLKSGRVTLTHFTLSSVLNFVDFKKYLLEPPQINGYCDVRLTALVYGAVRPMLTCQPTFLRDNRKMVPLVQKECRLKTVTLSILILARNLFPYF